MKLRINPLVVEDLKNIRDFIEEDNPTAAQQTIQQLYEQFEKVQQFPAIGANLSKRVTFKTDYKYIVYGNYVVLYKVGLSYVEIHRVLNRFQDITRIF